MGDVGGPGRWPRWCMGYQPTSARTGRLRVASGLRFEAEEFAAAAAAFTGIGMDVFRDHRGYWCVAPTEEKEKDHAQE